jgi:hypothetical protein
MQQANRRSAQQRITSRTGRGVQPGGGAGQIDHATPLRWPAAAAVGLLVTPLLCSTAPAQWGWVGGQLGAAAADPAVQAAKRLDRLESDLQQTGSLGLQQPSVWGEARLTSHRQEVERQLQRRLGSFQESWQAGLRYSDAASVGLMLSVAAADSAVASGPVAVPAAGSVVQPSPAAASGGVASSGWLDGWEGPQIEPVVHNRQLDRYLSALNELRRINEGDDIADSPGYALNLVRLPVSLLPGKRTQEGYGAQVSLTVQPLLDPDLLARTFRRLVIREVVDQFALLAVRFGEPQPELARRQLELMRQADRQATVITERLRELVEQQLAEQIEPPPLEQPPAGWPVPGDWPTRSATDRDSGELLPSPWPPEAGWIELREQLANHRNYFHHRFRQLALLALLSDEPRLSQQLGPHSRGWRYRWSGPDGEFELELEYRHLQQVVWQLLESPRASLPAALWYRAALDGVAGGHAQRWELAIPLRRDPAVSGNRYRLPVAIETEQLESELLRLWPGPSESGRLRPSDWQASGWPRLRWYLEGLLGINQDEGKLSAILQQASWQLGESLPGWLPEPSVPTSLRSARQPLPPSMLLEVVGTENVLLLIDYLNRGLGQPVGADAAATPPAPAADRWLAAAGRYLEEELQGAYAWLDRPESAGVWELAGPELERAIAHQDWRQVEAIRQAFFSQSQFGMGGSVVESCGWLILVHACGLRQQLAVQMQRELGGLSAEQLCGLHWPHPPAAAAEAFAQYVLRRWPVQVFALDPVSQEQNIAEGAFSRRQLQLALAVSVARGGTTPAAAADYLRRWESELQTVSLNPTAIGFAHGSQTFGWRFYPRLQPPPTSGWLQTAAQTFTGPPTVSRKLRSLRLEPGVRECSAVILVPSFVEQLQLSGQGHWFSLANPQQRLPSNQQAAQLQRQWQQLGEELQRCAGGGPRLLGGVLTRHQQLGEQLPWQHLVVRLPNDCVAAGSELFADRATDLAPQLRGWFGAQEIVPHRPTHLFLVGTGLSVHQTRILCHGESLPYRLISRQVCEVEIPAGLIDSHSRPADGWVTIQLATPYGVSSPLRVPVAASQHRSADLMWHTPRLIVRRRGLSEGAGGSRPVEAKGTLWLPAESLAWTASQAGLAEQLDLELKLLVRDGYGEWGIGPPLGVKARWLADPGLYRLTDDQRPKLVAWLESALPLLAGRELSGESAAAGGPLRESGLGATGGLSLVATLTGGGIGTREVLGSIPVLLAED